MTHERHIAVLRADTMVGSAFLLPILSMRVLNRAFPKDQDVQHLIAEGGVTFEEVATIAVAETSGGETAFDDAVIDGIVTVYGDALPTRPIFVDLATGHLYAVRTPEGTRPFLGRSGSLFHAMGCGGMMDAVQDDAIVAMFMTALPILGCSAVRKAMPALDIAEAKVIASGAKVVTTTKDTVARALLRAVQIASMRHQDITAGKITDEFGA